VANSDVFQDWSWDDPERCTTLLDGIRADGARCEKFEAISGEPPFTRRYLAGLGVTGIEFAAFRTRHPAGIGADYVPVRSDDGETEPGRIFLLDRESYFVRLDITQRLPFEAGCLDWVYAEHLIEHVPLNVGIGWLAELHRVMAPGALLRLTTPDLRTYVRNYLTDGGFFAGHRERMRDVLAPSPPMPARPAFMVNQMFYFYGHRWIYDVDELRYALSRAGFDPAAVRERSFRDGARPDVAVLDTEVRSDETVYVEVTR
jgi:predicted SAM-dependent methyltransferase